MSVINDPMRDEEGAVLSIMELERLWTGYPEILELWRSALSYDDERGNEKGRFS